MTNKWMKIYISAATVLIAVCTVLFCSYAPFVAFAAEKVYSGVLDDLKKDSTFDTSYYPEKTGDYSLQVIQLAESVDKELFVYVYQPSGKSKDLRASSVNISLKPREDISDVRNYKLTLLNSSGVFYKYRVDGLTVSTANTRYYTITTIYRPFDKTIDKQAESGNTITEINYNVSKQYCFSEINGEPFSRVLDIETIEITDKMVGFVRYSNGFQFYPSSCDSHFVAFNTDRDIDRLIEADVYYTSQEYSYSFAVGAGTNETFKEKQDNYAYLDYTQKVEHTGDGWFAPTYKWDRIETVEQFITENDTFQNVYSGAIIDINVANKITEEGKAALKGKKWVLRFIETDYSVWYSQMANGSFSTLIGDVTILRLKFETDGITYNLGVIDNKQTGSSIPVNDEEYNVILNKNGKWIIALLILILLLAILAPILPHIINAIFWVIKVIFKVITAPFKAIGNAVKKNKQSNSTTRNKLKR